ncbi:MAG TPA: M20/M25/M40 family metallo-hydrolase [Polyangia bacterium]|nr:M20/M25/M40 family metallo-hydrolase [Polyangia bacterium]
MPIRIEGRVGRALLIVAMVAVARAGIAAPAAETVDLDALHLIKEEGLQRSRVMEFASYLTDVYGPRLTGSPNLRAAGQYIVDTYKQLGLKNAHLEPWGPFGQGWRPLYFEAHVTGPQGYPLVGFSKAWTPGTAGRVTGEAVQISLARPEDLDAWRGKLRGKFVLLGPPRDFAPPFQPSAKRLTDVELGELAKDPEPGRPGLRAAGQVTGTGAPAAPAPALPLYMSPRDPSSPLPPPPLEANRAFVAKRMQFLLDEGVLAVLEPARGDAGLFIVQGGGPRDPKERPVVPQIVLAIEHYGRISRTLAHKRAVTIEMEARNEFLTADLSSFNVIGEVPGSAHNEVVMIGAHLDSWHAGTGATDNAAGSAVVMEAARILKATGLPLRRTVRVGLWSGEEEGLLGSRAYVKAHFADRTTMTLTPEHAGLSAYFNLDNGTGAIRGIYAQNDDAVVPIFEGWCAPLRSLGVTTVSPRNTGGTDHLAFDDVGLPGFQFIQDPVDYDSRTHHTNVDTFERLQPGDMMKNAVVLAAFAYQAAIRPGRLPRKPLPKPAPRRPPIPPSAPSPTASQGP